jgi:hypothetical protein
MGRDRSVYVDESAQVYRRTKALVREREQRQRELASVRAKHQLVPPLRRLKRPASTAEEQAQERQRRHQEAEWRRSQRIRRGDQKVAPESGQSYAQAYAAARRLRQKKGPIGFKRFRPVEQADTVNQVDDGAQHSWPGRPTMRPTSSPVNMSPREAARAAQRRSPRTGSPRPASGSPTPSHPATRTSNAYSVGSPRLGSDPHAKRYPLNVELPPLDSELDSIVADAEADASSQKKKQTKKGASSSKGAYDELDEFLCRYAVDELEEDDEDDGGVDDILGGGSTADQVSAACHLDDILGGGVTAEQVLSCCGDGDDDGEGDDAIGDIDDILGGGPTDAEINRAFCGSPSSGPRGQLRQKQILIHRRVSADAETSSSSSPSSSPSSLGGRRRGGGGVRRHSVADDGSPRPQLAASPLQSSSFSGAALKGHKGASPRSRRARRASSPASPASPTASSPSLPVAAAGSRRRNGRLATPLGDIAPRARGGRGRRHTPKSQRRPTPTSSPRSAMWAAHSSPRMLRRL